MHNYFHYIPVAERLNYDNLKYKCKILCDLDTKIYMQCFKTFDVFSHSISVPSD